MNTVYVCTLITLISFLSSGCVLVQTNRAGQAVYQTDCKNLSALRSENSNEPYVIEFFNSKDTGMYMFWVNYEGEEELYTAISPGNTWTQKTFKGHPWVARNSEGECIAVYQSQVSVKVEIK